MANLPKKKILDTEGNEVLPITHVSAVYDDNGTSVETLLTNMDEEIKNKIIEGYYINGSFYTAPPITHDYVEIGGTKWATMNLGALSETDYGLYFQWGDTQGYTADQVGSGEGQKYFGWPDYKYGNGTSYPDDTGMTKYNSTDGKTVLDASDDAVIADWGGQWRMPTTTEYFALGNAVNTAQTTDYQGSGVAGLVCTDKTDSSKELFFPAAGGCISGHNDVGSNSIYWSSSRDNYASGAFGLISFGDSVYWQNNFNRCNGFPIRAIYGGPTPAVIIPVTDAIYIDKATNTQYRWDGTAYVQLTKLTYTTVEESIENIDSTIISLALRKTPQSLSNSEKAQVLSNLGISDLIASIKNITISSSEPTSGEGSNGDIWLVYET